MPVHTYRSALQRRKLALCQLDRWLRGCHCAQRVQVAGTHHQPTRLGHCKPLPIAGTQLLRSLLNLARWSTPRAQANRVLAADQGPAVSRWLTANTEQLRPAMEEAGVRGCEGGLQPGHSGYVGPSTGPLSGPRTDGGNHGSGRQHGQSRSLHRGISSRVGMVGHRGGLFSGVSLWGIRSPSCNALPTAPGPPGPECL